MRIFTKAILFFSSLLLIDCRDKVLEDYYGRPKDLASPMYQQLEAKGNFKSFLACIDKAKYKRILRGAGYFTLFAPNDLAFDAFFRANGYSDISGIDSATAEKIVRYALVYNAFRTDHLPDYQSPTGWVPAKAFKRRTAYYDGVYTGTATGLLVEANGTQNKVTDRSLKIISSNRNGFFNYGDNNNKYIPYFMDSYFATKKLTAYDYNYFYPNTGYEGFNVVDAAVVTPNIVAENGIIHEVDKVILPLPNLEQYMSDKSEYSVFRNLIEKYGVYYASNPLVGANYKILTGSNDPVYVKLYGVFNNGFINNLATSPNCESFLKQTDNDSQFDGWSMFAPTNDVLTNYLNTVLLEHYHKLDSLPVSIIADFINAHMWQTTVWPSKFQTTVNYLSEPARFDPAVDVVDRKVLSNGIFYGTNKVQQSDLFHSVFGPLYLDPHYSLMTRYVQSIGMRSQLTNPFAKFTVFMLSDNMIRAAGIDYDLKTNQWFLNGGVSQAVETLDRLVNLHVAVTGSGEFANPAGQGVFQTLNGEYIGYNNNKLFSAGNFDPAPPAPVNPIANIIGSRTASNGKVYYLDNKVPIPTRPVGLTIKDGASVNGAVNNTRPYYLFYMYLFWSGLYTNNPTNSSSLAPDGTILGLTSASLSTMLIPTNASMMAAFADGKIPVAPTSTTVAPPWAASNATNDKIRASLANFLYYHMLARIIVAPDGKEGGGIETLSVVNGDPLKMTINNSGGAIKITDAAARTANVVLPSVNSNVLANRSLIHQIDNYLNNGQ